MRANLFVYRDMDDPWLRADARRAGRRACSRCMPGLRKLIGEFEVLEPVKIRPVDLYVTHGHRQAGVVLVGDAFATSCPAAGTGSNKVFTDVERLCNVHIPRWLADRRHGRGQDRGVLRRSGEGRLRRRIRRKGLSPALAVDRRRAGLAGAALGPLSRRRPAIGALRQARERLPARSPERHGATAGSEASP